MDNSRKLPAQRRKSRSPAVVGIFARLFVWYIIITALFRCPQSALELSDISPVICKPYFQARTHIDPYLKPYYDDYAAKYVDMLKPYLSKLQTTVYNPTSAVVGKTYQKYAAPRVSQAWQYAEKEWDKSARPLIDNLQDQAASQYNDKLGPYVEQAQGAAGPYAAQAKDLAQKQYKTILLPTYQKSLPYAQKVYETSRKFAIEIGVPYMKFIIDKTSVFIQRRIWPPVRVLYGQNVEPQLAKIKERLTSYRDGKKLESMMEAMDEPATFTLDQTSSSISTHSSAAFVESIKEAYSHLSTEVGSTWSTISPPIPTHTEAATMSDELKQWQIKFAKAADRGAEDLKERISEITDSGIRHSIQGLGAALVTELEETSVSGIESVKTKILKEVSSLADGTPTDEEENAAYDVVLGSIRAAGGSIKNKAQALRVWKVKQIFDIDALVQSATDSTLDVIDGIRDLGLQEIGLRWASMDHATYQDWAEYHKLKKTLDDWRVTVSDVASKHDGVAEFRKAADDLEDQGMSIAQDAAKELASLKDIAKWKIHARDVSDEFEPHVLPAAAVRIGQKLLAKVSSVGDAITGSTSTQGTAESIISIATESASNLATRASEAVIDPIMDATSNIDLSFTDSVASLASRASGAVKSPVKEYIPAISTDSASSLAGVVSSSASSLGTEASLSVKSLISTIIKATEVSPSSLLSATSSATETFVPDKYDEDNFDSSISAAASSLGASASISTSVPALVGDSSSFASTFVLGSNKVSEASSSATSVTSKLGKSVTSVATIAASAISGAGGDVVDGGYSASQSIKSLVEEAGNAYSTVTRTLRHVADL